MNGKKRYQKENVYQATQARLKMIFEEFDNICVAFSGGKDSGMVLNLCLQYMRKHNIKRKIGVFHQDFEAQYSETTNYTDHRACSVIQRRAILQIVDCGQQRGDTMSYDHIMLDLETMSTQPDAAVVAIGAVYMNFITGETGPEYYAKVSLDSAVKSGGLIDPDTIIWWLQQSDEARQEIVSGKMDMTAACIGFAEFIDAGSSFKRIRIWGDGAAFDNVILGRTFSRLNMAQPWKFWNDRCYRTMKNTYKGIDADAVGVAHSALDDARKQAGHLLKIVAADNLGPQEQANV